MFTEKDSTYWRAFSEVIDGRFVERQYWHSPKAIYAYKEIEVIFDNYYFTSIAGSKNYESFITRVGAKFTYHKLLTARIEKASLLNRIVNFFNGKLYKTKDPKFDYQYHIHANHPEICLLLQLKIKQQLIDLNIEGLFIGSQEGIWGDSLPKNQYEIAIYLNTTRLNRE